jgi:hypothetical protein
LTYRFTEARGQVYNRGRAPTEFLTYIVDWARDAPDALFDYNDAADVYAHVKYKLGPWKEGSDFLVHRRAVMCEVLRTLCGFESSWDWEEGIDMSANHGRPYDRPKQTWEAGILQASADSMSAYASCKAYAAEHGIGVKDYDDFRALSMRKGVFPIQYGANILRSTYKHHGPLKRTENDTANPQSSSIHPYLSRGAVEEFMAALKRG